MKFGGLHFKDHPVEAAASTEAQLAQGTVRALCESTAFMNIHPAVRPRLLYTRSSENRPTER